MTLIILFTRRNNETLCQNLPLTYSPAQGPQMGSAEYTNATIIRHLLR